MKTKILLDTNIIIFLLKGNENVLDYIENKDILISFITELELLSYAAITEDEENIILQLIDKITVIDYNANIKNEVINLRRKYHFKLMDSIILVTAKYLNLPIFTADKVFPKAHKDVEIVLIEL